MMCVGGITGQTVTIIDSVITCQECEIRLLPIATIGESNEHDSLIVKESHFAMDSHGRFYVAPTGRAGQVIIFDRNANLVDVLGVRGDGIGSFEQISRLVVGPGDTVHIFDPGNMQFTVLSPEHEVVRVAPLIGSPYDVIVYANGHAVFQTLVWSAELAGLPNHLVNERGQVLLSFGASTGNFDGRDVMARFRAIAKADSGQVWSAYHNRYDVELWDPEGQIMSRLVRRPSWFIPWHQYEPLRPTLRSIRQDEQGLLWVLITVPDSTAVRRVRDHDTITPVSAWDDQWDTVIEVINPRTGALIASTRLPTLVTRFVGDVVYSHRQKGDGTLVLDIWRAHLARSQRR
jgi:hypothetical protein